MATSSGEIGHLWRLIRDWSKLSHTPTTAQPPLDCPSNASIFLRLRRGRIGNFSRPRLTTFGIVSDSGRSYVAPAPAVGSPRRFPHSGMAAAEWQFRRPGLVIFVPYIRCAKINARPRPNAQPPSARPFSSSFLQRCPVGGWRFPASPRIFGIVSEAGRNFGPPAHPPAQCQRVALIRRFPLQYRGVSGAVFEAGQN